MKPGDKQRKKEQKRARRVARKAGERKDDERNSPGDFLLRSRVQPFSGRSLGGGVAGPLQTPSTRGLTGVTDRRPADLAGSALLMAMMHGDAPKVQATIASGAKVEPQYLRMAADVGELEIVRILVEQGADLNSTETGGLIDRTGELNTTPLMNAAQRGFGDVANFLLDRGADVRLTNGTGKTALYFAAAGGDPELVQRLLQLGAEVNRLDSLRVSALIVAAQEGHVEVVRLLLDHGARLDHQDGEGDSALIMAAQNGHQAVVEELLARGAVVNLRSKSGESALTRAARHGFPRILQRLLAAGANPGTPDQYGNTPLHLAAVFGHLEIVKLLVAAGAALDPVSPRNKNQTPLGFAASYSQAHVVDFLAGAGASLAMRSAGGFTPLMIACVAGDLPSAAAMIRCGADVNALGDDGKTALHTAVGSNQVELVKYLLAHGASATPEEVNRPKSATSSISTNPPLDNAVSQGNVPIVAALLAAGAANDLERSELDQMAREAKSKGHTEVSRLLASWKLGAAASVEPVEEGLELAQRLQTEGLLESAEQALTDLLDIEPENAQVYLRRAQLKWERKDLAGSEEDLSWALRLQPGLALAHRLRAAVRSEVGKPGADLDMEQARRSGWSARQEAEFTGRLLREPDGAGCFPTKPTRDLLNAPMRVLVDRLRSERTAFGLALAFGPTGMLLLADAATSRILRIRPDGIVEGFAGASPGYRDGSLADASFLEPLALDWYPDEEGFLVCDAGNHCLRKITGAGQVFTLDRLGRWRSNLPPSLRATWGRPSGLAVNAEGTVFLADAHQGAIFTWRPGRAPEFLAGIKQPGIADGAVRSAWLSEPMGMAAMADGSVVVADRGHHAVRRVTPDGRVTTLAGNGSSGESDGIIGKRRALGGPQLNQPVAVAVATDQTLYVADSGSCRVREIIGRGHLLTFAGSLTKPLNNLVVPDLDPIFESRPLEVPYGLAYGPDQRVYVAQRYGTNPQLVKICAIG